MKGLTLNIVGAASIALIGFGGLAIAPISAQAETETRIAQARVTGSFVTVEQDHATTGTARLISINGQRYVEFDAAFDTARGPNVQVVLYRNATVPVNLTEGSYITLAPLQSFSGTQRYLIPANANLEEYGSVAIWCQEFNVTFGYATL